MKSQEKVGGEGASGRASTRLWQRIAVRALASVAGVVQRLPRPAAMRWGTRLGRLAYHVARRQRRYAERNLRLAYGDALTPRERDDRTRRVFENFGKTLIDFLRTPILRPEEMERLVAGVEGWEWAEAARREGRGIIILTAHLGNWEFLGRWLVAQGLPLTVVAREPEDAAFGGFIRDLRENAGGYAVLNKGASARGLLSKLKRGEAVGILPDQNSGDLFVPFFGVPAGTVAGPASLALHTGALLLPSYCLREPDDRYRMLFLPPIPAEPTGDRDADVTRVMTEVNRVLESVVRQYPDQWLWLHNRWKSAFEEGNRSRWPAGFDGEQARARWGQS